MTVHPVSKITEVYPWQISSVDIPNIYAVQGICPVPVLDASVNCCHSGFEENEVF